MQRKICGAFQSRKTPQSKKREQEKGAVVRWPHWMLGVVPAPSSVPALNNSAREEASQFHKRETVGQEATRFAPGQIASKLQTWDLNLGLAHAKTTFHYTCGLDLGYPGIT